MLEIQKVLSQQVASWVRKDFPGPQVEFLLSWEFLNLILQFFLEVLVALLFPSSLCFALSCSVFLWGDVGFSFKSKLPLTFISYNLWDTLGSDCLPQLWHKVLMSISFHFQALSLQETKVCAPDLIGTSLFTTPKAEMISAFWVTWQSMHFWAQVSSSARHLGSQVLPHHCLCHSSSHPELFSETGYSEPAENKDIMQHGGLILQNIFYLSWRLYCHP
jgi:hypothetical protein